MKEIDCRGLNCPEPVLRTKSALTENPSAELSIIVDNETARENVLRFARSQGRESDWQEIDGVFKIHLAENCAAGEKPHKAKASQVEVNSPVLFIATDKLGQGCSELSHMLMRNFIYTLTKRDDLPRTIVLINSGVRLSIKESPVIEELEYLEGKGVLILVCGTCLDYYKLKKQQQAGQVSNMYDIADLLFAAPRVITI